MNTYKKIKLAVAAAATIGFSLPAGAVVVIDSKSGWEVSFDGNINQFYVWTDTEARPKGVIGGNMTPTPVEEESSRFRTGMLPAIFGFNVEAPTWNGLEMGARISIAVQVNNANTMNTDLGTNAGFGVIGIGKVRSDITSDFGASVELREAFFTIEGTFGQILLGRTLSLFMAKNILTDQTLFGVGAPGNVHGGGFTLGRIGYGYLYPNFNAQIRWTSPAMNGFKVALAAVDPSKVCGEGSIVTASGRRIFFGSGVNCARVTDTPRAEGEISYASTFHNGNGSYLIWVAGMWQNAERHGSGPHSNIDVWGWTVGTQIKYRGFEFTGSYYRGEGLGTSFLLDADSLDATGQKRDNAGWLVQIGYTFMGRTTIAASYGQSGAEETANDKACRLGLASCVGAFGARIKEQRAYVIGIYHDVTPYLKLVAEYSRVENEWYGGQEQQANVVGIGGYFFW